MAHVNNRNGIRETEFAIAADSPPMPRSHAFVFHKCSGALNVTPENQPQHTHTHTQRERERLPLFFKDSLDAAAIVPETVRFVQERRYRCSAPNVSFRFTFFLMRKNIFSQAFRHRYPQA